MNIRRSLIAAFTVVGFMGACIPFAGAVTQSSTASAVDPAALQALSRMSSYLRTLQAFEVTSTTRRDEVYAGDQKLQFGGSVTYKVRKPNGFFIEVNEDRRIRQLYYDGKQLTLFSPRMGFYGRVPAPPTIRETLDAAAARYDVHVPLEDLFTWGTDQDGHEKLTSGSLVGYANINGQESDQYAFRQKGVDWQIWIARGDKPVPLQIVISDVTEPSQPQFQSTLKWNTAPHFAAETFAFKAPAAAKQIKINGDK